MLDEFERIDVLDELRAATHATSLKSTNCFIRAATASSLDKSSDVLQQLHHH
jgi:hypothetical protein